jgi:hypothetical protein
MVSRRRLRGAVLLAVPLALASAAPSAATSERATTSMFLGNHRASVMSFDRPGRWDLDCEGYDGGYVSRGPRHRERINVHYNDGVVGGYSRLQPDGRFLIYVPGYLRGLKFGPKLTGVAVRRSATRWDITLGRRRIGHTSGPDGAEAATAVVTIC